MTAANPDFSLDAKRTIARAVRAALSTPADGGRFRRAAFPHGAPPRGFWAKITGHNWSSGDSRYTFSWTEQTEDATDGNFVDADGGRTGDATGENPAYNAIVGHPVPTGTVVWLIDGVDNGTPSNTSFHFVYGAYDTPFRCQLSQNGGSAGSDGVNCDFSYDIVVDGDTLQSMATVARPRVIAVQMTAATDGYASIGEDGSYTLLEAWEVMEINTCASS